MAERIVWPDEWAIVLVTPDGASTVLDRIDWTEGCHLKPRDAVVTIALMRHALRELERAHPEAAALQQPNGES